jgi:hypothetical protein
MCTCRLESDEPFSFGFGADYELTVGGNQAFDARTYRAYGPAHGGGLRTAPVFRPAHALSFAPKDGGRSRPLVNESSIRWTLRSAIDSARRRLLRVQWRSASRLPQHADRLDSAIPSSCAWAKTPESASRYASDWFGKAFSNTEANGGSGV